MKDIRYGEETTEQAGIEICKRYYIIDGWIDVNYNSRVVVLHLQ